MKKSELIEQLKLYPGDPEVIFSFASCDYPNMELYEYKDKIIIDIDEMDYIDYDNLDTWGV